MKTLLEDLSSLDRYKPYCWSIRYDDRHIAHAVGTPAQALEYRRLLNQSVDRGDHVFVIIHDPDMVTHMKQMDREVRQQRHASG